MRPRTLLAGAAFGAFGVSVSCVGGSHYLGCNDEGVPIYISGVCPEDWAIEGPCGIEPTDTSLCYDNGHSLELTMAPLKSAGGNATCTITLFWDGVSVRRTAFVKFASDSRTDRGDGKGIA